METRGFRLLFEAKTVWHYKLFSCQELDSMTGRLWWVHMPRFPPWRPVKACDMTHGARLACCPLKRAANCRGGQRGVHLLWSHIHATAAGQHRPLHCLLCLLFLLLSRVTTCHSLSLREKWREMEVFQVVSFHSANFLAIMDKVPLL